VKLSPEQTTLLGRHLTGQALRAALVELYPLGSVVTVKGLEREVVGHWAAYTTAYVQARRTDVRPGGRALWVDVFKTTITRRKP